MNELIEKLKDKNYVRAFGLMEEILPGSQATFRKVGPENCLQYNASAGWEERMQFDWTKTYAIKPDYQPEPEFVDVEIELDTIISVNRPLEVFGCFYGGGFIPLRDLPSLSNFECFWKNHCHEVIYFDMVAKIIARGHKVYARFRV